MLAVGECNPRLHLGALRRDFLDQWRESEIEAYDLVLRMIDNVLDLLGKQARIDGVENGSHARHHEIHLEVAIRIPRERAYPGRWPDPQRRERIRQLPRSFMRVMVSV